MRSLTRGRDFYKRPPDTIRKGWASSATLNYASRVKFSKPFASASVATRISSFLAFSKSMCADWPDEGITFQAVKDALRRDIAILPERWVDWPDEKALRFFVRLDCFIALACASRSRYVCTLSSGVMTRRPGETLMRTRSFGVKPAFSSHSP